jgi:hypothetical protein
MKSLALRSITPLPVEVRAMPKTESRYLIASPRHTASGLNASKEKYCGKFCLAMA